MCIDAHTLYKYNKNIQIWICICWARESIFIWANYMVLTTMALRLRDYIFDMKLNDSVQVWGANAKASFNRRIYNELAQWKFVINISIE